ncbi:type I-C CRISPR-associated endonuclease Cas1c [Marinithermus hydrothermalis]|uniref:CRISPR-associated endonuclease Cas1 n=1 Tax=Marinithermus hydrothermalis (strain DSM 14884 / JCM 11576 / T1) TaxID=869210 RepID=F2NNM5_MARHT|nr:type I-C CRISPR-associated endonuclease Cas1c [Marinithermus hydrothermalis]AEB11040.1 CRISPR-associated protein Cas1 [Marinithermus hydrothermalis DSM 14884]
MNRVLLNTLFVQTQGAYLHLDHEVLEVKVENEVRLRVPLHHLGNVAVFGQVLVSPFLIHKLVEDGKELVYYTRSGRFRGRLQGPVQGNVLLRRAQHKALDTPQMTLELARGFVLGKIRNARGVLLRARRDDPDLAPRVEAPLQELLHLQEAVQRAVTLDELRGVEGMAAVHYFTALAHLVRVPGINFSGRNRRPPRDPVNALLSFLYTLLMNDVASALEGVGLDPQVGYLHALRPGRLALALDLMEEFRPWFTDRLALSLINRKQVSTRDFDYRPGGAVMLNEEGRKKVIVAYQKRKQEEVSHPLFKEKIPVGLVWHVQARLLARRIREDLETYVAFTPR